MINDTSFNEIMDNADGILYPFTARLARGNGGIWSAITCSIFDCKVNKGSAGNSTLTVGTVFNSYIEMTVGSEANIVKGEELRLEIGIVASSSDIRYITMGYYTVTTLQRAENRTTFTATGRIDSVLGGNTFTVPDTQTISNILSAITVASGLTFTTTGIDMSATTVLSKSVSGMTCKEALQVLCAVTGAYATETNDGNIIFFTYGNSYVKTFDAHTMSAQPTFEDSDFELDNIKVLISEAYEKDDGTTEPEHSFIYDNTEAPKLIVSNQYMAYPDATMFNNYCTNLKVSTPWAFRPTTATFINGDPRLEAQDVVRITVDDTNYRIVPCMSIVHTVTGGLTTQLVAPGTTEEQSVSSSDGPITQLVERTAAEFIVVKSAVADKLSVSQANIDYARIDRTNINEAWVKALLVQGHIIAQEGTIYVLDAVQITATNIKTGTLDVERLLVTDSTTGIKHFVTWDSTTSAWVAQTVDADNLTDLTITADKIVSGAITADKLTTNVIYGTGGWIQLGDRRTYTASSGNTYDVYTQDGTNYFYYENGTKYTVNVSATTLVSTGGTFEFENTTTGNGITWDGSQLTVHGTLYIGDVALENILQFDSNGALIISTNSTQFATKLTSSELGFYEGGLDTDDRVAFVGNKKFQTQELVVTNKSDSRLGKITLGNYVLEAHEVSGLINLRLKYEG